MLTYPRIGEQVREARLRIFLSGRRLVDDRLLPLCSYCAVVPAGMWGGSSLAIRDLDGDRRPEVVVDLGLGGAHDVPYTYIYSYTRPGYFSGSATFDRLVHIWGDFGVRLRSLSGDRTSEFVSHDPRFFGRFDCSACSRGPVQIWRFRDGRLADVTRRFRGAILRDLASYRSCLPSHARRGADEAGCLPGWAGDEALLGRAAQIWPVLAAARRNGNLADFTAQNGAGYVRRLRSFLRATGYVP